MVEDWGEDFITALEDMGTLTAKSHKVAILVPDFLRSQGPAQVAYSQAKALTHKGKSVDIFALSVDWDVEGIEVFNIGISRHLLFRRINRILFPFDLYKALKWIPKLREYDLIIAHMYPLTWLGWLSKRLWNTKKYVYTYHGFTPLSFFPRFLERLYVRVEYFISIFTVKNADGAIAVSEFGANELWVYAGIPCSVIYPRINEELFNLEVGSGNIRSRLNIGNAPVLVFVSHLRPQKGVHLLLKAFHLIKEKVPDAYLLVIGKSEFPYYFQELMEMANENVIFTGAIPREELPLYYGMCDLYVSCSLWENFNLSVPEARACGKPVVVFDIPPFRELKEKTADDGIDLVPIQDVSEFAQVCIEKITQIRVNTHPNIGSHQK